MFRAWLLAAAALLADPAAYGQRHAAYQGAEQHALASQQEPRSVSGLQLYPTKHEPAYRAEYVPVKPPELPPSSEAEPFVVAVREYARVPGYFFSSLRRASQAELGPYVLGRCWPATGEVEVLSGLYGDEFREVLAHEFVHLRHPDLSESEVRQRTRLELGRLGIPARWH